MPCRIMLILRGTDGDGPARDGAIGIARRAATTGSPSRAHANAIPASPTTAGLCGRIRAAPDPHDSAARRPLRESRSSLFIHS